MRAEKCTWHNMGPHADWSVDLTVLPQGLIAFTGKNGKGKSYSLESAVAGSLYRTMPTQGTVASRATAADSWQEFTFAYAGRRYRIKHSVNGASAKRTGETLVVDADTGKPVYEGTGSKQFDAWAAKNLPDPDVLFASIFAAQQSEGFVKMTSGERIGIVLRVIGVARFERMAASARKNRDAAQEQADALNRRIADIRGSTRPVADCEELRQALVQTLTTHEAAVASARAELAAAREADAAAALAVERRNTHLNELAALQKQLLDLETKREPIALRIANNRAVLADAVAIRGAVDVVAQLEKKIQAAEPELVAAEAAAKATLAPWEGWETRVKSAQARAERAKERAKSAAAVRDAVATLPSLRDVLVKAEAEAERLVAKLDELQAAHVAGAAERIEALRSGLTTIAGVDAEQEPDGGLERAIDVACKTLDVDNEAVAMALRAPAQVAETRALITAARARVATAEQQVLNAERLAARAAEVDGAEVERAEAEREVAEILAGVAKSTKDAESKVAAVQAMRDRIAELRSGIATFQPAADRAAPLANAETRLAELEPQLTAIDSDIEKAKASIAMLPPLPELPSFPVVGRFEIALTDAEANLQSAQKSVARAEQALEFAKERDAQAVELEAQQLQHMAEVQYWTRLALDFGRDGIQSAEVDSAGPELTELVNDLLHTCHGPRFTVSVETQRSSADGKKTIEECNIRVIDTVAGTDKEIREHSGGERVILGEAVSLALTMLACRRAGWERPTLIRDESAAALDPGNAKAWVAMMRRAVELTGADRLLFVSHSPEVIEMADYRVEVGEPSTTAETRAA